MTANEVRELIALLRQGTLTLDEVAERFRRRHWLPIGPQQPVTAAAIAADRDPGGDVPGSYDEVTAAYDSGELTSEQYRVLSEAVADAINAESRRRSAEPTGE